MKVVFLQDVRKVARKGEIKDVSEGYARNFLFPKKMAEPITPALSAELERSAQTRVMKEGIASQLERDTAAKIDGKRIVIKARAKDGKLFGSISAKEIAAEIGRLGIVVEEKRLGILTFKEIGEYPVKITFSHGAKAGFTVAIEAIDK